MKNIYWTFLFLFFVSCYNKQKTDNPIDLENIQEFSFMDIVDSIDVIQLETNDNCLISSIRKVLLVNNRYFIMDEKQQAVFCFDITGKNLFNICRRGQGPEDYLYLADFNIDMYNNHILLLEPFGSLLIFDLDGNFISKIKLPKEISAYNELYVMNADCLIFISVNKYQVVYYSQIKNKITDKKYKIDNSARDYIFLPNFKTVQSNGEIYFSPPLTNSIIKLSDNSDYFTWNFGKKNNSSKMIKKLKKEIISGNKSEQRDYVGEGFLNYNIIWNYESSRYRISMLDYGKYQFRYLVLDKRTGKTNVFDKTKENISLLLPDFSDESIILYDKGGKENSAINLNCYNETTLSDEQKIIVKSHDDDDNPFLIKYNLKQ